MVLIDLLVLLSDGVDTVSRATTNGLKDNVWIFTIVTTCLALATFVSARISEYLSKKRRTKKWVNEVITTANELGASMGISQMNHILENIGRVARGDSSELTENPHMLLYKNIDLLKQKANNLDFVLSNGDSSHRVIIESFQNEVSKIVQQYLMCREDVDVIAKLCEKQSVNEMKKALHSVSISSALQSSINAAFDSNGVFNRGNIIGDIIGLTFVDEAFPDFEGDIHRLCDQFGKSVLSRVIKNREKTTADHSSPEAMYEKAEQYLKSGVTYPQAFLLFQKAAEGGFPEALYRLGECYENGTGCAPDPIQAFSCYEKAAEMGLPIAEYRASLCYQNGIGCEKDMRAAIDFLKRAAKKNHLDAMVDLGLHYRENGDERRGKRLIWSAANLGSTRAQCQMGHILYGEKNKDCFMWFKKAAENDNLDAMLHYGHYLLDVGLKQEGIRMLKKSARGGLPEAQFFLGLYYTQGFYVDKNLVEGADWFEKSAEAGYGMAQFVIGKCYYNGEGRTKNLEKARDWYNSAIKNKVLQAYVGLALLEFSERHPSAGKELCEIAAREGNVQAHNILANCYENGFGTQKNLELAEFHKKAAEMLLQADDDYLASRAHGWLFEGNQT